MSETQTSAAVDISPETNNTVTDSTGRVIKFRVMDPGDMLDMLEMAGTASSNHAWIQYASVMFSVTEINGVPVPTPANREQMKALAKRVGNEGLVLLTQRFYGRTADAAATKAAEDNETAKN